MAWFVRAAVPWVGRKVRMGFVDSDPSFDERWRSTQPGEQDTQPQFASPFLDIDLTQAEPPVDFYSSSFDLRRGLTVSELPLDRMPAELQAVFKR